MRHSTAGRLRHRRVDAPGQYSFRVVAPGKARWGKHCALTAAKISAVSCQRRQGGWFLPWLKTRLRIRAFYSVSPSPACARVLAPSQSRKGFLNCYCTVLSDFVVELFGKRDGRITEVSNKKC